MEYEIDLLVNETHEGRIMAVGYRSFLDVDVNGSLIDKVIEQVGVWARAKGVMTPVDRSGRFPVGPHETVTVVAEDNSEGSMYRWRRERPPTPGINGRSRTSVIATQYPDHTGWLWTEIECPEDVHLGGGPEAGFMCAPRFLGTLIEQVACYDGRTPISAAPLWVNEDLLPELMGYLTDDSRRGSLYVVSQGEKSERELEEWAAEASREVHGIGAMFLLEPPAEAAFNELVGQRHAIVPGTVRTYAPSANPDDPLDARRHQVLSRAKIEGCTPRRIGFILGAALRDRVCRAPVPDGAEMASVAMDEWERQLEAEAPADRSWTDVEPGVGTSEMLRLEPAGEPDAPMSEAQLRAENARLRRENEILMTTMQSYQRHKERIRTILQTMDQELTGLHQRLNERRRRGRLEEP